MPTSKDLHGNAPDTSAVALLLIDVMNDLEFEGGDRLLDHARVMATHLAALKARCKRAGIPAIYVNDNFGHWQSDFRRLVDHCRRDGVRGASIVAKLAPEDSDYFVLKPKHSGFYETALSLLLQHLSVKALILTGIAGDNCVLFTAHDAYLRDYRLFVPRDCIASIERRHNTTALHYMERVLKADTRPAEKIALRRLVERSPRSGAPAHHGGKAVPKAAKGQRG